MSLLFAISDLRNELNAFGKLASEMLAPGADAVLRTASGQLDGIAKRSSDAPPVRWSISRESPLYTQPSYGAYMPDDKGGLIVYGEITFIWELQPIRPKGDTRVAQHVLLNGIASTAIRLLYGEPWDPEEAQELAMWRMEIADHKAPGTFFHVQVLGREEDKVFPKELDIPRLPGVLNSPFACMEFVLSELFQERWIRIAQQDSAQCRQWRAIQAHRHRRHLDWAAEKIENASGSPWVAWKAAKPYREIFLSD